MNSAGPERAARACRWLGVFVLALVFTLLNAFKPLTMDDGAYIQFATHMAKAPSDPYGFSLLWYNAPKPGPKCYTPPVFLYWWSFALRLFGDQPFLWKLWMLPFALLLAGSLYGLFRHFARGLEMPLTVMTVLSATFLPSMNLMLDVPGTALGLTAVALLLHAFKLESARESGRRAGQVAPTVPYVLAILAGLAAGLAVETKYSGVVAPAALVLAAVVYWRPVLGGTAGLAGGLLILGIEWLLYLRYDTSLFIEGLWTRDELLLNVFNKTQRAWALVTILGGVAPAVMLLGRAALGAHRLAVLALGVLVTLSLVLMAFIWIGFQFRGAWVSLPSPEYEEWKGAFSPGEVYAAPFGLMLAWAILVASWRLCRLERGPAALAAVWSRGADLSAALRECLRLAKAALPAARSRRADWFLVLWLGLEVAGYFFIAPVPGVRRVLGVVAVVTVLLGRLASRTCRTRAQVLMVYGIAAFAVLHGLFYHVVDWYEARAQQSAAHVAAEFIRERRPNATIWFTGFWGLKFHAERLGMRPVYPGRPEMPPDHPGASVLAAGDWLVVPGEEIEQQQLDLRAAPVKKVAELASAEDPVPYRTVRWYYFGYSPLEGHAGPRFTLTVYRVLQDFTAMLPSEDEPAP